MELAHHKSCFQLSFIGIYSPLLATVLHWGLTTKLDTGIIQVLHLSNYFVQVTWLPTMLYHFLEWGGFSKSFWNSTSEWPLAREKILALYKRTDPKINWKKINWKFRIPDETPDLFNHFPQGYVLQGLLLFTSCQLKELWWWCTRSVVSASLRPHGLQPASSSVHGIFQERILEWVTVSFSRGSSPPTDRTWVSRIAGGFCTDWATKFCSTDNKTVARFFGMISSDLQFNIHLLRGLNFSSLK